MKKPRMAKQVKPQSGKGTAAPVQGSGGTANNFKAGAHKAGISSPVGGFGPGFTKSG